MNRKYPCRLTPTMLAGACAMTHAGPVTIIPISLSGDDAPGLIDTQLASFSDVRINDAGDVVFWAELEGPNVTPLTDGAILRIRTGELSVLLLEGEPAPWYILPADFVGVPGLRLAEDGTITFIGAVSQLGIPDLENEARNIGAFEIDQDLAVVPLVRKGEQAPALDAGTLVRNPSDIALSPAGASAIRVSTWTDLEEPRENAVYSDRSGSVELIAASGDVLPHAGGSVTLDHLDAPVTNADASLVFRSALDTPRFPQRDYAILSDASGELAVVLATGDPAPGLVRTTFATLDIAPSINSVGDLALHATLRVLSTERAVNAPRDESIWKVTAGSLSLITRRGDQAPGTTGTFATLASSPNLNDAGDVAFWATADLADDTGATGIWIDRGAGPEPVAVEGGTVFGLAGDVRFAHPQMPMLDNRGRVVFLSTLQGADVSIENDRALLVRDEVGRIEILLREGDEIDASGNGDLRVVAEIIFDSGSIASGGQAINASRQAAVVLRFEDDSLGVFVINATAPADLDGDADIDAEDFFLYLDAFASGDLIADFDQDGDQDAEDFFAFLDAFLIL